MKFVKLLTVPAVLLTSLALAVPASAHTLMNATVNVACQSSTGKVCVTLAGKIESQNEERLVVFDLFAKGSTTKLDEITFDLPAFDAKGNNDFSQTLCFKAITDNVANFVVDVVKVTDKAGSASDLVIQLTGSQQPIVFAKDHQQSVQVGETGKCAPASPPPASPPTTTGSGSGSGSSTSSPPATTVALAQTGGFDFRFPLIGLAILVAGAVLYFVSVSRGRSASQR